MYLRSVALLGLLGCCLAGCGGTQLAPVTGTVKYNGKPLKQGQIGFIPEKGRPAYGKIVDGQIVEVTTFTSGDGVSVGKHQVQVTAVENANDMYKARSLLPARYGDPRQSGLQAEIPPGGTAVSYELKGE